MGRPKGAKNKHHAGHSEDATIANKSRFLKEMASGYLPSHAAERCHLGNSTVFAWKANDPEFAKAWQEAYELGLDKLERAGYESGLDGNASNLQFILKGRRREIYGTQYDEQRTASSANFLLQIAEQEHRRRLERLGLVAPNDVIEGDYEEIDATVSIRSGDTSSTS